MTNTQFKDRVIKVVRQIPEGCVATYGQIAALAGSPRAARVVGQIAHYGDSTEPWHRIVNKQGGLARAYPGGIERQVAELRAEGVVVNNLTVNLSERLWQP